MKTTASILSNAAPKSAHCGDCSITRDGRRTTSGGGWFKVWAAFYFETSFGRVNVCADCATARGFEVAS